MDVVTLARLLPDLPLERTRLLDNLGRIRREVGPITPELSDALADHMNIRRGEVHEVVSFYSFLQVPVETPRVCTGPVCDCYGARELLANTPGRDRGRMSRPLRSRPGHDAGRRDRPRRDAFDQRRAGDRARAAGRDARGLRRRAAASSSCETRRRRSTSSNELKASGLTGYGGAGFPTGIKWEAVSREPGPRFVVVNADEGEPGTIKDRFVMELRPHLFLEGVLIAMTFAEATEGLIYLREEYATARNRLLQGIDELRAAGLLEGRSLALVIGAGAYIAGEETAMLESMEGRRAMPRLRPPFPAQVGYLGRPTLINNVETLAHLPAILRNGGKWWAGLGTRGAAGTRLWSVTGAVGKPGCYEAPNGVTTRELVEEHAGGFAEEIGAIVPGGAASGILPPSAIDAPLTREGLREYGAGVGSAAVQVFPARYSPLRLLAETMRFFAEESCQKCTPCRIGNRALHHLCEELEHGRAPMTREKVDEWLLAMEKTSICGLGQASPIPVRNAMHHWPELFAALG